MNKKIKAFCIIFALILLAVTLAGAILHDLTPCCRHILPCSEQKCHLCVFEKLLLKVILTISIAAVIILGESLTAEKARSILYIDPSRVFPMLC